MTPERGLFSTHDPLETDGCAAAELGGSETTYVRVAVERSIHELATLTYACDPDAQVGDRVVVPLGRGDALTRGIIVETGDVALLDGLSPKKVKPVRNRDPVGMPASLVELARWAARYYASPLGMTLATMVPGAVKQGTGLRSQIVITAIDGIEPGGPVEVKLTPAVAKAWEQLGKQPELMPAGAKLLAKQLGLSNAGPINKLVSLGLLGESELKSVRASGSWSNRSAEREPLDATSRPPSLTEAQSSTIQAITGSLGSAQPHVLHGVTGSGKTEVYLGIIQQVLDRDEGAIVLVPEISLTPQTSGRFLDRFGRSRVAVLHSGLTASERHDAWRRLRAGDARVVVGARSAVFAPIERLGVIVVDEEHDASYKQDQVPRYHARDLAIVRGSIESCPVVLGSATPSLESWSNVKRGRFLIHSLPDRVGGGTLPRVDLVDMREERRSRPKDRRQHALGPTLELAIERTLVSGGQAILLINRRGFAGNIGCASPQCGWTMGCESCSVRMVLHKDRSLARGQYLRCHHCHAESLMPERCPECSGQLRILGAGTQRLEDEIEEKFGSLDLGPFGSGLIRNQTFARIDADTMRSAKDYFNALDRFGAGEYRLLLGTQMISKGLDFPNVRLVGVVDADAGLTLPDFRATERTFQLISQVAGRAGRADHPGRVIIQTLDTEAPALVHASSHDFHGFIEQEHQLRTECDLPPAWRLARIVSRDRDPKKALERVRKISSAIQQFQGSSFRVEGPMECVLAKLSDHYRYCVELYAQDSPTLVGVLDYLCEQHGLQSDSTIAVDVDPVSLL